MKKVLLFMSILCLCLGTVACGKNTDAVAAAKPESGNNDVTTEANDDATTDTNDGENNEPSQEEPTTSVEDIVAKDEIVNASWDSGLVQINDKIIQMPQNLNDLVDLGFDYEIWLGKRAEAEKSYLMAPGERVRLSVNINGTEIYSQMITNETDDFILMSDINPLINDIGIGSKPEGIAMYFPGGLTFGDSYKLITEKFGKANEVTSDMTYRYGEWSYVVYIDGSVTGNAMEISCDKNEQCISGFRIVRSLESN